jgi:methionyl-tRNA synthetase
MKEVVDAVQSGLGDLSISRPTERLSWGIRVPEDESQTIYVWLDALMNYVTKAGYPWAPGREQAGGWPADCQVIGKDIVRFHCIYWPAFLMALGLPLPRKIVTHAHWTLRGSKMSKSTGTVVDPFLALDRFGPDVMRVFMAHDGPSQDDASYDNRRIILVYEEFLSKALGNLASRLCRGKRWSIKGAVQRIGPWTPKDWENEGSGARFCNNTLRYDPVEIAAALDEYDVRKAIKLIWKFVRSVSLQTRLGTSSP